MYVTSKVLKIKDKRAAHRERHILTRGFVFLFGVMLLICGLLALVVFPEAGIVFLLAGLAFLSLEFEWAFIALHFCAQKTDQLIHWFKHLSRSVRLAIEGFFLLLLIATIWYLAK